MQISQMLQSKISGTKKRLSETVLNESVLSSIAICGLLLILTYASRVVTLGGSWGFIPLDIPVVSVPIPDNGTHTYTAHPKNVIGQSTLVVALTAREIIFGDLAAFTTQKDDVRNKFLVPHIDGSPQVKTLLQQIDEWSEDRARRLGIRSDGLVILVPDTSIPVAIIAGVSESLRASNKFTHVMLGGGLI
jgi:hypothetical protein